MPTALITGINGQDGSYLANFRLLKGYSVDGISWRGRTVTFERIAHFQDEISVAQGDAHDKRSPIRIFEELKPGEIHNLGAQSFLPKSYSWVLLWTLKLDLGLQRKIMLPSPRRRLDL
jgi:GDPmannose 4,6-dehydratase